MDGTRPPPAHVYRDLPFRRDDIELFGRSDPTQAVPLLSAGVDFLGILLRSDVTASAPTGIVTVLFLGRRSLASAILICLFAEKKAN